ncbi:WAS/WASL-interacting protein family member 1-like [Leopardus geoffroyi]|uniref:WAS/WASL-interacting protein family member 1-like n=1 Tax=Leopardus geoffroyi TaxID=46844 RepID=UPI001E2620C1|nr:WAS/WASL-interacting protein family member 1-like [Leopardus geoffroyi]
MVLLSYVLEPAAFNTILKILILGLIETSRPLPPHPPWLPPGLGSRPRPHLPSAPGGCFGLGPPPPLLLPTAHGRAREPRAREQGRLVREERQGAPPPSESATPLWVNRKPGGGRGGERRHRNFPPRLERRRPGPGLGLPGRRRQSRYRSPLRAPARPPPPPAPPLPPVNGQRWSLNRALNHLNAICAPGPHLLPPTAARSVTPLPTGPARPSDPAANRAAAYSNRRAGAAPRMLRRPPLARPQRPTGVVVRVREGAILAARRGSRRREERSWRALPARAREPVAAPDHAGRRRCRQGGPGAQCRQLCQSFPLQGLARV